MSALDILIGRQPVFDAGGKIFGYELLLHDTSLSGPPPNAEDGHETSTDGPDTDLLRSGGVLKLVDVGIDRLVGDRNLQLKVHPSLLKTDAWRVLPPQRTVLVVRSKDVEDPEILDACSQLVSEGIRIATDHGVFDAGREQLLGLTDIIWFDISNLERSWVSRALDYCTSTAKTAAVIDVNLKQELDECSDMGFTQFQGYLLSLPQIVAGKTLEGNKLSKLRLSAALLDSETNIKELESIVTLDPSLTHQVLQLASAGGLGGQRREIRTIRQALILAGWRRLQSWVALLMLSDEGETTKEEITTSLVRARMCELVARKHVASSADLAYTAGMLSSFDLLLKVELDTALKAMPLDPELLAAVKQHQGKIGEIVADVILYQTGRAEQAVTSGVSLAELQSAMAESLVWAVEATSAMKPVAS